MKEFPAQDGSLMLAAEEQLSNKDMPTPSALAEPHLTLRDSNQWQQFVSVIIPCYKQAHFLPEAVASVVAQTYPDFEIVIVNDGSPDNTRDVAHGLMAKYPDCDIRLVQQPNGGLSRARNAGIQQSRGRYFLPLDADDRIAPSYLAKAVDVMKAKPDVGFVYSHIQHFGERHNVHRLPEFDPETMIYTDNVASVCSLVRRIAWEQVGGYNPEMRDGYEDWDFWIGCIENMWKGYRIAEPLFFYRKTTGSMLHGANDRRERLIAQMVLNHRALYAESRQQHARQLLEHGEQKTKPHRILLACTHFWPSIGGLETIVENLGSQLVKLGYEVAVATLANPKREFPFYRGMRILELDPKAARKCKLPRAAAELGDRICSGDYDACVLLADPLNWIFWSLEDQLIPSSTRVIGQPIINTDGFSRWKDDSVFRSRLRKILARLTTLVAISTKGTEVEFLRKENMPFVYLPNATTVDSFTKDFRSRFGLGSSEFLFLHVANLWPVKNHLGLMQVMRDLLGEWRLVMIGHPSGDNAYVNQVRTEAAQDQRFLLIPGMPHHDVEAAMEAADVVLLPSLGEVSPVTILEAMSHGKPWVATPECGAVHDNAGGVVVPLAQFPAVLHRLMAAPGLRQRLGSLGSAHWSACFNWQHVASAWEDVIWTGRTETSFVQPVHIRAGMAAVTGELAAVQIAITTSDPKVTVIVPTHNRAHLLPRALESILNQTYQDFEIIVINDGGAPIDAVLATFNKPREKLVLMTHSRSRGAAAARNTGLRAARGKYIAYLDDDDIYLPNHLETLVAFLEGSGNAVAYTDAYCLRMKSSEGNPMHEIAERFVPYSNEWDNDRILYENFVPVLCFMHERSCICVSGYFDESLRTHEDWDMWIRLSRHYHVVHLPLITCEFLRNEDERTLTNSMTADFVRTTGTIYEKHKSEAFGRQAVLRKQRRCLFNEIYSFRKSHKDAYAFAAMKPLLMNCLGWRWYAAYWLHRKFTRPFSNLGRSLRGGIPGGSAVAMERPPAAHRAATHRAPCGNPGEATKPDALLLELLSPTARRPLNIPLRSTSAWAGHSAFAYDLVRFTMPQVFVELGTHAGYSYFSFCHAVKDYDLETACHAVDTWRGDEHAGYYDDRIVSGVHEYNQQHFAGFSTLHRMTFDDAAIAFGENSIDLLHIDGLHRYEAVKHDWQTWLSKVRPGGIVLFHDIGVSDREFGVWRLWEELAARYPAISFEHESGLGVLCKGAVPAGNSFLQTLFNGNPMERAALRCYYRAQMPPDEVESGVKRRKLRDLPSLLGEWILQKFRPESFVEIGSGAGLLLEYMCANVPDAIGCDMNPLCRQYFQGRNPAYSDRYFLKGPAEFAIERPFDLGCSIEVFQNFGDEDLRSLMAQLAARCSYFIFSSTPHASPSPALDMEWGHINLKQPGEWDALFAEFHFKRMPIKTPITHWASCYENVKLTRFSPKRHIVVRPLERIRYWFRRIRGRDR